MSYARKIQSIKDKELVLFLDEATGQAITDGVVRGETPYLDRIMGFRTGLVCDLDVAGRIMEAINHNGIKVEGLSDKCLDYDQLWIPQIMMVLYYGMWGFEGDRFQYLKNLEWIWETESNTPIRSARYCGVAATAEEWQSEPLKYVPDCSHCELFTPACL